MIMNSYYILLLAVGFALGWATGNFVYGRTGCKECFVALICGRRCDKCDERKKVNDDTG